MDNGALSPGKGKTAPCPPTASSWLATPGVVAGLAGTGLLIGGGAGLGRQLTPFPKPVTGGALRQDGVYAMVRHPMYGGALLLILGWALLSSPLNRSGRRPSRRIPGMSLTR